jgi:hypothetical protein
MASKRLKPPASGNTGRLRDFLAATAIGSDHKSPSPNLQDRRAIWLARRFNLSLAMAEAVAGLAFPRREATR